MTATATSTIAIWDQRYAKKAGTDRSTSYLPWLDRWRFLLASPPGHALDLGCGLGLDAEVLSRWGFQVTAVDVSRAAIELSKARNPGAIHAVMDVRDLDCLAGQFDLVIANLSLHYFKRESTVAVFKSVYRLVKADGVFAFRVNAFDDVESGAPSVLPGWECVSVGGIVKQFFTREKIEKVLGGRWRILSEEKLRVWRYNRWKSIFEVIARKNSD